MKKIMLTICLVCVLLVGVVGCMESGEEGALTGGLVGQSNSSSRNSDEYSVSKNRDIPEGIFNEAIAVKKACKKYFITALTMKNIR